MIKKLNLGLIALFILLGIFFATSVHTSGDSYALFITGRQTWQEKKIPTTASFIYGPQKKTLFTTEWLSALIYYLVVSNSGSTGLIALRIILALLTIYFIYLAAKIFTANNLLLLAIVIFAGYILSARTNDRPESFSYLFAAIVNYSYLSYIFENKLGKLLYSLPVVSLVWPSIHPFSVVGVGLVGFYTLFIIFEKAFQKKNYPRFNRLIFTSALSIIFGLIQYYKLFAFLKAGKLAGAQLTEFGSLKDRVLQTHGYDLLNQIPYEIYFYLIFSLIFLTLTLIYLKKTGTKKGQLLLGAFYLLFLTLPLKYFRTIPLVIIVTLPQFVLMGSKVLPRAGYLKYPVALILAVLIILTAGSIPNHEVIGSRVNTFVITSTSENGRPTPVGVVNRWWADEFPEGAPQILSKYVSTRNLFTDNKWNNFLVWNLPGTKIFANAQSYDRTAQDYDEENILKEGRNGWEKLLEKFNIDTVVKSQPDTMAFVYTPVQNLANWKLIYLDDIYMIYARSDVIKSLPVDLSKIKPELPTALKFKKTDEEEAVNQLQNLLKFDPKNGFARDQLIIYYIDKDVKKAISLAEQSRQVDPNNPVYSLHLAEIYTRLNDCTRAKSFADEAKIKSFHHPVVDSYADEAISSCKT